MEKASTPSLASSSSSTLSRSPKYSRSPKFSKNKSDKNWKVTSKSSSDKNTNRHDREVGSSEVFIPMNNTSVSDIQLQQRFEMPRNLPDSLPIPRIVKSKSAEFDYSRQLVSHTASRPASSTASLPPSSTASLPPSSTASPPLTGLYPATQPRVNRSKSANYIIDSFESDVTECDKPFSAFLDAAKNAVSEILNILCVGIKI